MKKISLILLVSVLLSACGQRPTGPGIFFFTPGEIILWMCLFTFYISALLTVALMTFRKGRIILGIFGFFFPLLWLIGAILPAKPGSKVWIEQGMKDRQFYDDVTR